MTCDAADGVDESDAQKLESEVPGSESDERNLSRRAGKSAQWVSNLKQFRPGADMRCGSKPVLRSILNSASVGLLMASNDHCPVHVDCSILAIN
jgi:hypothetical protein